MIVTNSIHRRRKIGARALRASRSGHAQVGHAPFNIFPSTGEAEQCNLYVQTCPRALIALRYLYEEMPQLHVIAAGSLLEFAMEEISFAVGRVRFLNMYPLTFAEFIRAGGNEPLFEALVRPPSNLGEVTREQLLRELKNYFFVGGMPEAVRTWYETASMLKAFAVQSEILDAYRQDFSKYTARADKGCLNQVSASCAARVGEQISYSGLATGFSNPTMYKAFDLLCQAQVLHKIAALKSPMLPLGSQLSAKRFKASLIDVGLMQRLAQLPVDVEIRHEDLLAIYRGKLAEQFVARELLVIQNRDLYYWSRDARNSAAEVDYLLQRDGTVYPLDVKSGHGGSLRSLHLLLTTYVECPQGIALYSGRYGERPEQKIRFVPLYFSGSLCA